MPRLQLAIPLLFSLLPALLLGAQNSPDGRTVSASKERTRVMPAATDYGLGAIGLHRVGRPSQTDFVIGVGLFSATNFAERTIDGAVHTQRGLLLPVRLGVRHEFVHERLSSLDYTFYWVGTVGPVLAFGYPQGLEFQQTLSRINLGLGAEVYNALGLEASFDVGFALYLEGGVYAMNTFASRSLFRQSNYLGPSLAIGIRTGF